MDLSRADLDRPIERAREAGPARRAVDITVAVVKQTVDHQVFELAAALAYRFFMALFPFFLFLTALSGFVSGWIGIRDLAGQLTSGIGSSLPPTTSSLVEQEVRAITATRSIGFLTFGAIIALYLASAGVSAVMLATNQAYGVEESRSFWRRYAIALGLTLVGAFAVIGAFVLFLVGNLFSQQVLAALGLGAALGPVLALAGWAIAFALLFLAVVMLYRVAPNLTLPWRRVAMGGLLFTVGWLIATWAFSFYLANMGNYGATFGALAGAVVLLTWLYLTAIILLVGAELNAVLDAIARPEELDRSRATAHTARVGTDGDANAKPTN
ncbi:MAG: YihY/virulence factor BrkB family protein [Candidatus Limnocylindrales bacterium]